MTTLTRRSVTPIFTHDTRGAFLQHRRTLPGAEFAVTFRPYLHSADDFNDITRYASPGVREMLVEHKMFFSELMQGLATHVLIVEVRHDDERDEATFSRFKESIQVHEAAISAIRLTSSAGVWSERTFHFHDPLQQADGMMYETPNSLPSRSSPVSRPSVLEPSDFTRCINLIDALRARLWSSSGTNLDDILRLAWSYHRLALTFEQSSHGFLILMIIFEAMFRRDETEDVSTAAKCIGRLLGATKNQCKIIQAAFNDDFRTLRNKIAHGSVGLSVDSVSAQFPLLYDYASRALADIALFPFIDSTKNYYDEIASIADRRYVLLPRM